MSNWENPSAIDAHVVLGGHPASDAARRRLTDEFGVTAVLSLQTDEDLTKRDTDWESMRDAWSELGVRAERVAIRDLDPKDFQARLPEALDAMRALIGDDHRTYVHCNYGANRSPTLVITYKALGEGLSAQDAFQAVKAKRYVLPYQDIVEAYLADPGSEGPS